MLMEFFRPDRFVLGTLGEPGKRRFILQISGRGQLVSVEVEKQQILKLGRRLGDVMDQLMDLGRPIPEAFAPRDMGPLDSPVDVEFKVGGIGLAWDNANSCTQIELFSEDPDDMRLIQIWLTPSRTREFVGRVERIIEAGRPACPVCGQPIFNSHICPRSNGYRRPLFHG
ncbi:DUF3090 domain-containing protein [Tessaracoccus sp. OH4464_COT-324]|uniref:DUF3090 domain-containing protein n=1 Tax=Tessaracoccus sp. OH4464_COT-324 TaxID=2491059 RepID=UPI000F639010|nr:DUF3090 domain-containing protein [Tessaracoccus sp. OH4464_COT-324]RRD46235.1 DUF3090 domain-containing protein [Tessaracoccus sp. OH4464_COT-324]